MMGYGFLFMLLLIAIPLFGFVFLVLIFANWGRTGDPINFIWGNNTSKTSNQKSTRKCASCEMALNDEWKHCPNCGKENL